MSTDLQTVAKITDVSTYGWEIIWSTKVWLFLHLNNRLIVCPFHSWRIRLQMPQCHVHSLLHANSFSNNTCPCQAVPGKCALGCLKMTPWQLRSSNMLKVTGSWLNHKGLEPGHNQWWVLNCRICSLPRFIGAWILLISQACCKTHLFSEAFPEGRNKMRRVFRWFDRWSGKSLSGLL